MLWYLQPHMRMVIYLVHDMSKELCLLYAFHVVPSSPPNNVSVGNITSTSFLVMWQTVPVIDMNGNITLYDVEYTQTTLSDATMPVIITVDSSTRTLELNGLEEYAEHSVRVRAYTSIGAGPYSDVLNITTNEDGV